MSKREVVYGFRLVNKFVEVLRPFSKSNPMREFCQGSR